ncbi:MAG: glycoprotease [Campylobacter sp.]|nr:glycoprotease [Campylobacter sp.]
MLFESFSTDEHASEAIISILERLNQEFNIQKIIYANTPGSFMGLKIAYVILQTFCTIKSCEFYAVNGFELSKGTPIKANKKLSFVKNGDKVSLLPVSAGIFEMPQNLNDLTLSSDTLPDYMISAV